MALYDVFISYSSNDQKVVEGICGYLESRGIRCFVAFRDIPKGVVWASAIVDALDESQMMVVAYSDSFNLSPQVDREIELAAEDNKPILTFRLSDSKFKGAKKYYLKNLNWIDAFPNPDQYFGDLYQNVCKLLGKTPIVIPSQTQERSFIDSNLINAEEEIQIAAQPSEVTSSEVENEVISAPPTEAENLTSSISNEENDLSGANQNRTSEEENPSIPSAIDDPQHENIERGVGEDDPVKAISVGDNSEAQSNSSTEASNSDDGSSNLSENVDLNTQSKINGYEWVDLGLPSGLKWATCNVGASKPEQYGGFFAWGEVEAMASTKVNKNIPAYGKKYEDLQNDGIIDQAGNLTKDNDAATHAWGSPWRMPTQEEIKEFEENTKGQRITLNGVNGKIFTSKINGNSIFFPAAGMYDPWGYLSEGVLGHIWSSTAKQGSKKNSYMFIIRKSYNCVVTDTRYLGFQVRPVCK